AGASRGGSSDSLQILASADGGRIWKRIASISGSDLKNNGNVNNEFVPSNINQWKAQTVAIPASYLTANKVFFKFRYWAGEESNNVYFDRFSLTPFTTDVTEVANDVITMKVYPNPSNGNVQVSFKTGNDGKATYQIKDITGKLIYTMSAVHPQYTVVTVDLNNVFPSGGMYLLSVQNANHITTEKVVIIK
ncbi:MAG: T9SS type A sorting domain-containing protein, partial [Sphingobacteriales bacterium]